MEVSMGRPSGTAQTIMVTATVTASSTSRTHSSVVDGMLPVSRVFAMMPATMAIAPT